MTPNNHPPSGGSETEGKMMSDQSDVMADTVKSHADLILRASGSGLRNYTMVSTRNAILSAVMDLYEEAYRAGADFADKRRRAETVKWLRDPATMTMLTGELPGASGEMTQEVRGVTYLAYSAAADALESGKLKS